MALVDINTLGAPRFNFLETMRSYEHGMIRQRDKIQAEQERLDTMKREVNSFFISHVFKPLGIELGHFSVEVGFTRPEVGENPELRVVLYVADSKQFTAVSKKLIEWNLSHVALKPKDGWFRAKLVLHEYLNHTEARMPRPIR